MDGQEKITIMVNKATWETLCEDTDAYKAEADNVDLCEIKSIAEKLVAEGRTFRLQLGRK